MPQTDDYLIIARIGSPYGLNGWQHLQSFSDPPENIVNYRNKLFWQVIGRTHWEPVAITAIKQTDTGFLIKLADVASPEAAKQYSNAELAIRQADLPELAPDEFYWSQLIGLKVYNLQSRYLGKIIEMLETGSNDVMVLETESGRLLLPYLSHVIQSVDLSTGEMRVDWQPPGVDEQ